MRYIVRKVYICALFTGLLSPSLAPAAAPDFADPAIKARWDQDEALVPGYWGTPITERCDRGGSDAPGVAGDIECKRATRRVSAGNPDHS